MGDDRAVTLTSGATMPLLGFGTWQLHGRTAYDSVRSALESGYRHLDTATMYANEAEVGRAVRDSGVPRSEVFVTTKMQPQRAGHEAETLAASLNALSMSYVDLWLVHAPPSRGALVSVWQAFLAARDRGLAHDVGVSNYSLDQIDELIAATGQRPAVNQIPWSPWEYDAATLAGHRERSIVLEGYSPFKRSNLRAPALRRIAAAHGVDPAQVVLRWHLEHGIVVIPKSATPARIAANADIFGFSLTPDEMATLDALAA